MADPSKSAPAPPAFPSRLGNTASIWEAVVNDEGDEESLEDAEVVQDDSDDGEFMTEDFRADLRKLEVRAHYAFLKYHVHVTIKSKRIGRLTHVPF